MQKRLLGSLKTPISAIGLGCMNLSHAYGTPPTAEQGERLLLAALDAGFDTVKFFPASLYGGVAWLKAIHGPIPQATFCPTGGIQDADIAAYLACANVAAFGSSAVATRALISGKHWDEITARAKRMMSLVRAARPL